MKRSNFFVAVFVACIILLFFAVNANSAEAATTIVAPVNPLVKTSGFIPNRYITWNGGSSSWSHLATDYDANEGQPIMSIADGTVKETGYNSSSGNYIVIEHNINGVTVWSRYQHFSQAPFFSQGASVTAGQQIGTAGSTGNASGPHLHIQIYSGKYPSYVAWDRSNFSDYALNQEVAGPIEKDGTIFYSPERIINGIDTIGNGGVPYRSIPDGHYIIGCENESSLYLDIKGNDYPATNSTGIYVGGQLTGNEAFDKSITWTVKYEGDGYYSIKQFKTNMALTVYSDMVVYQDYGTETQLWAIIPDGENGYRIQAKCNGYYLDVKSGYPNWGSDVQLSSMRSTSAQGWVFTRAYGYDRTILDGNYIIGCEGEPSLYLDIMGNEYPAANSTGVYVGGQLTGNDVFDKSITWTVKYEDDGYYSIKQYNTEMALSVYSEMVVYQDFGTKTQRWAIVPDGENGYRLQAKYNDMYLDVKSGYPNWGSDVQLSAQRSISAQGWVFTAAYDYSQTIPDGNYIIGCEDNSTYFLDIYGDGYPADNSTCLCVGGPLSAGEEINKSIVWTIKYESDGFYSIKQYNTNMAITVYADMVVYQDYGTDTQRWAILPDGAKGYRIQAAKYNKNYLDIESSEESGGSSVRLHSIRDTSAQGWVFIPYELVPNGLVVTPSDELLSLLKIKDKQTMEEQTDYYSAHIKDHLTVEVTFSDGSKQDVDDYAVETWIEHSDNKPLVYRFVFKTTYGDISDTSEISITLNPLPVYGQPDFTLPAAIIAVDESAFEGIAATIVYIPDTCTSIGKWAFRNCPNLTQIHIPANCIIGTDAFAGCNNVMIFSTKGSAAETYANSHSNCTFVAE